MKLEKPGAPKLAKLEAMKANADVAGINIYMGFNKNVSAYLTRTREFAIKQTAKCDVTILHNKNEVELAKCYERNAKGMLKNMAIHELAILVTY
jgi:predicted dehydrogenase